MVKNPRKSSIFGCGGGGARSFFRGGRGSFFRGGRLHFREKKKSLFSRKNVRRLLCWYSGCVGAMQQVQNKKFIFSPLGRALAPRRRGTCVFFRSWSPREALRGEKVENFMENRFFQNHSLDSFWTFLGTLQWFFRCLWGFFGFRELAQRHGHLRSIARGPAGAHQP